MMLLLDGQPEFVELKFLGRDAERKIELEK